MMMLPPLFSLQAAYRTFGLTSAAACVGPFLGLCPYISVRTYIDVCPVLYTGTHVPRDLFAESRASPAGGESEKVPGLPGGPMLGRYYTVEAVVRTLGLTGVCCRTVDREH